MRGSNGFQFARLRESACDNVEWGGPRPFIGALDIMANAAATAVVWLLGAVTANLSAALGPIP